MATEQAGRQSECRALVDYHTHPMRTAYDLPQAEHYAHFRASMDDNIRRAAQLGLVELGFSEHIYRLTIAPGAVPWKSNPLGDMGSYVRAVEDVKLAQRACGAPQVRLSMEVDVVPSTVSIVEAALPLYPFDYLLGSVHEVPDLPQGAAAEDAYAAYYATMRWGIRSGLFSAIAHPDRIHRKIGPVDATILHDLMRETVRELARAGMCVEMSSAGVRAGMTGIDPNTHFATLCLEHGVPITLGSDAHKTEAIGEGLPALREWLWALGYREFAVFEARHRELRPLPPPAAPAPGRDRILSETAAAGR